jgi:hypothetical protein
MKKSLFVTVCLSILLLGTVSSSATQRVVLGEMFTSTD